MRMNAQWVDRLIVHASHGSQDDETTEDASFRTARARGMAAAKNWVEPTPQAGTSIAELARRAAAIAHGDRRGTQALSLSPDLSPRIEAAELRARALADAGGHCDESRRGAALDFVAGVATALTLDPDVEPAEVTEFVAQAAAGIGIARGAANLVVFQRALASPEANELPPRLAYWFVLQLLVELGPAEAVSLWTSATASRTECVASAGEAAKSRRLRVAARVLLLDGRESPVADPTTHVRGVAVARWDRPHAALIARGRPEVSARLAVYLAEAAATLSRIFESERLFERNEDVERLIVAASERRLTRLGCDLHDGPLQDIVALADELRRARAQVSSALDVDLAGRVHGRFDDLEARLVSLDQSLRDISQAIRSTNAVQRPLEEALRAEVDALNRAGTMQARLTIDDDVSGLTASQRIVLFRVVQEALSNARRHSGATHVRVRVHSSVRYVSVTIADDGRGFDVAAAKRSGRLGLTGILERVRLLGGDIEVQSGAGRGTRVRATLPRWSRATDQPASVYAVTV
jgi:signal transduction histidine kinase